MRWLFRVIGCSIYILPLGVTSYICLLYATDKSVKCVLLYATSRLSRRLVRPLMRIFRVRWFFDLLCIFLPLFGSLVVLADYQAYTCPKYRICKSVWTDLDDIFSYLNCSVGSCYAGHELVLRRSCNSLGVFVCKCAERWSGNAYIVAYRKGSLEFSVVVLLVSLPSRCLLSISISLHHCNES